MKIWRHSALLGLGLSLAACLSPEPEGIAKAKPAATTVKFDFLHKPLPEIPLPNDIATRRDPSSATGRRINASMIAPTQLESRTRELFDQMDGWGIFMPISIPFDGPLDVASILAGHRDEDFDPSNDVVYLINVDPDSPEFGRLEHLDVGNGSYPIVLEDVGGYWDNDPRGWTLSIFFDEADEDLNGNGVLDPGEDLNGNRTLDPGEDVDGDGVLDPPEDTDADGVLDRPNYLPGLTPAREDLAGRADALMSFYESETHTLLVRPMVPLKERTTYAVVVTRRLLDAQGEPVGSPFPSVNHAAQTEALMPLLDVLPAGLSAGDIAFAFSFTTQSVEAHWVAVRDGMYGYGVQAHLDDEFPAKLTEISRLVDTEGRYKGAANPYILYQEEWATAYRLIAQQLQNVDGTSAAGKLLFDSLLYPDFMAIGSFQSPQLFDREDAAGNELGLNDQSWPPDLDLVRAKARAETVYFWLSVPRKEISLRGEGKQPPLVILGHGYGSNRFELASFAGFFAEHGMATITIDCVSHGLGLKQSERDTAYTLLEALGLVPWGDAALRDRAWDQNGDGVKDSAADFWTGYVFHTRDVVRQCAVDYMQLVKIIRSFDGVRRWDFDLDGDGQNELAGDFDADGVVDVGAESTLAMIGGSLGGIMAMVVGGLEPELSVVAPVAGGAGLADIGNRSLQGGVREAVVLRMMGPLYTATVDETGLTTVQTIVPDLNDVARVTLAKVERIRPGDTMRVLNLTTGEAGCGYIDPEGKARASLAGDLHDPIRISFYRGPKLVTGSTDCALMEGADPSVEVRTFQEEVEFQARPFPKGSPLVALAEGYGFPRATPGLRRFLALGQMVLDPGDPASLVPHLSKDPLTYPGTGQTTGAHALIVTTTGDMNVPASSGLAAARAAGFVDYLHPDPRYGKPANQVVVDSYNAEAVHNLRRFVGPGGEGVHLDLDNFSQGTDPFDVPRLDPPLRIGFDQTDRLGGYSGTMYPYAKPSGTHAFDNPGAMTDRARSDCRAACPDDGDGCGCDTLQVFDVGAFMFNMLGRYLRSGGTELDPDLCHSRGDCPYQVPPPPPRSGLR